MESTLLLRRNNFNIQGPQPYIRPSQSFMEKEHVYMNSELLLQILEDKTGSPFTCSDDKKNSYSTDESENIYENTEFLNSLQAIQENKSCDSKETMDSDKNVFVSSLSITLGENSPNASSLETTSTPHQPTGHDIIEECDIFKSSYAKELADSFKRNSREAPSPIIFNDKSSRNSLDITSCEYRPMSPISQSLRVGESSPTMGNSTNMLKQIEEELAIKEEQLAIAQKNIYDMKLEICQLKCENRCLKQMQSSCNEHLYTSSELPDDSENFDEWSMKRLFMLLKNRVEKAEMQKRTFESACRQLAEFLQTMNTHLTTVSGDNPRKDSSVIETNELLMNLQNTLSSQTLLENGTTHNGLDSCNKSLTLDPLKGRYKKGGSSKNQKYEKGMQSSNKNVKKSKSKNNRRKSDIGPGLSPLEPIQKTSSVMDLWPLKQKNRINRAASAQCIADYGTNQDKSLKKQSYLSSRNRGFFSSLKNIFKMEATSSDSSQTSKKKRPPTKKPKPVELDETEKSLQNSIFYVSYEKNDPVDDSIEIEREASSEENEEFTLPDLGPSLLETIDRHQCKNSPGDLSETDMAPDVADSGYVTDKAQLADNEHEESVETIRSMSTV